MSTSDVQQLSPEQFHSVVQRVGGSSAIQQKLADAKQLREQVCWLWCDAALLLGRVVSRCHVLCCALLRCVVLFRLGSGWIGLSWIACCVVSCCVGWIERGCAVFVVFC